MDFREIRWQDVDWMHLAEERDQWRSFLNSLVIISFSTRTLLHDVNYTENLYVATNKINCIITERENVSV
jgi:hypothetical protein